MGGHPWAPGVAGSVRQRGRTSSFNVIAELELRDEVLVASKVLVFQVLHQLSPVVHEGGQPTL